MTQPIFDLIPLSSLHISKRNMRAGRKKPAIDDLVPNIKANGLYQNLLVQKEDQGYGVVAGRRRWFALQAIAEETKNPDALIPCMILTDHDDASAIEASLVENIARLPASEMEQYAAFARLARSGRSICDIARFFGVTELYAKRVLALGDLIEPIRKLYDKDEIHVSTIRALTLASKAQQKDWLKLYKKSPYNAPTGKGCRDWIMKGHAISTDKALFDLSDYKGRKIADLFGDNEVFDDPDVFWDLQSKAISKEIEALRQKGWNEIKLLERGQHWRKWDHEKRARTKGGRCYVEVRHDGSVNFHVGYVTCNEARKLDRAGSKNADGIDETPKVKSEMSGPLAAYIALHRHNAARVDLLSSPKIAFRLMIAHALCGSENWDVRPHNKISRKEAIEDSIAASKAEALMTEQQARIADLLQSVDVNPSVARNADPYRTVEIFMGLLRLGDQSVMEIAAYVMADTLDCGGPVVEALASVIGLDMARYWSPDEAFFDLVKDKRVLNAMVGELAGQGTADAMLTDTAKAQRETIKNRIKGNGCAPNRDWRPKWMATPPMRYVDDAPCVPADAYAKVKGLVESDPRDEQTNEAA